MDPLDRIDQIITYVEGARSMPMSRTNCVVDRAELIDGMERLRSDMPVEIRRAAALLEERDKIIEAGQREAERIIAEAEAEHTRLVSVNEIVVSAEHEAARLIAEARAEAQRLREEVDDFVDTTLANFEQLLTRSLASIERGRDKMHALREIGSFSGGSGGEEAERPLPFCDGRPPRTLRGDRPPDARRDRPDGGAIRRGIVASGNVVNRPFLAGV